MARLPAPGTKARWILAVVVVAALLGVGFTYYNRLNAEQDDLLASIALSNKTIDTFRAIDLAPLKAEVADLQTRASTAERQEASLTQRYQGYSHSIEIEERLYRAATEAGVTINSLSCAAPKAEDSGGIRFESYSVSVDAEAEVPPSLLNFLLKVSGYFESAAIESVDMSIPRPPEEGSPETTSTMSLTLRVVYIPQEAA